MIKLLPILCLSLTLISTTAHSRLRVVTTTTDLADLVEQVGGERVQVESIGKRNQDLHYVQARPSFMVKLQRADLLVSVGLDLEIGWLPLLIDGSRNPDIRPGAPGHLDLGRHVRPIEVPASVDASLGHLHPKGNPHYWLDPVRVSNLVPALTERLSKLDPEHADEYASRSQSFHAQLNVKIQS